jgi:hypothetical protein
MKQHSVVTGFIVRLMPILLACLAAAPSVPAASFVINNLDGPGEGFNDTTPVPPVGGNDGTTLGQQRLNLFQKAAEIWGTAIDSAVPIIIQAQFDPLSCNAVSAVLGAAGTINIIRDFTGVPEPNTWYHSALANALAGVDLIPGTDDIVATFNSSIDNNNNCLSGTNWYLGYDHNNGNDIDLLVVLLHEFAHGLGFSGFTNFSNGRFVGNFEDIYSHFTLDNSTGLHWNEMNNRQRKVSTTNTGNVVWDGSAVVAAATGFLTGGTDPAGHARLYAPSPVESGSSISHFDTVASPNLLMEPFINSNLGSDLDLTDEQLFDVGWTPADADGDGVADPADNCPNDPNPLQENNDGDAEGDVCDDDDDNDGTPDTTDAFPLDPSEDTDTDSDGIGNNADTDDDGDGYSDVLEVTVGTDPLDDQSTFLDVAGDINGDGQINAGDLVLGMRILTGLHIPTVPEQARFDIAPLSGGLPIPDGNNNAGDYLILQGLVSGSISF